MRRILGGIAIAAASCYSPHVPIGVPCDPSNPTCPSDQVCAPFTTGYACLPHDKVPDDAPTVGDAPDALLADASRDGATLDATSIDGAMIDAATTDTDGDGIPDGLDNCPTVSNPGQENEDGDRFGDACDSCPPFAHDSPSDPDGDGVSDECDPHPNTAGDSIVLFEGFHHGIPTSWASGGTWTAANDSVSVTAGSRSYLSTSFATTQHETVSAAISVDTLPSGGDASTGIVDDFNHTRPFDGLFCHLMRQGGGTPLAIVDLNTHAVTTPYELVAGVVYILNERRDGALFTCAGARGAATATISTSTATTNSPYDVGFRANHIATTYKWLMVVSNP